MSNNIDYNLNDQIYENSDKTIKIFKTRRFGTIKYIAVKVYNKKYHKEKYNYEYTLIKPINNLGIVNIMSSSEDHNYFYMEMEFCATGDLSRCLWQNKNNPYSERTIKQISTQLLTGLQALHKNGIIHCNLKPSNILIDEYGNVKICDFKKSLKVSSMNMAEIKKNKTAMTPCYTAPELFQEDGKYSFKSDLWALGCIMYELAVGQVPFFDESIGKLISKIINDEVNFNKRELSKYSDSFIEILKRLLIKDPNNRTTWGEIERFDWWEGYFFNNNKDDIKDKNTPTKSNKEGIDALRLSRIVLQNIEDSQNGYNTNNNLSKNEVNNADQEFDFQDKDTNEEGMSNNTPIIKLNNVFPVSISVLKISKVFKRDKRTYNDINAELLKSNEEELPSIEHFVQHQTDRVIKPIIGNRQIEETQITNYNKNKLSFTPWKKDALKEMMNNPKEVKNVENYLYNIYSVLDNFAAKNDYDNLLNLLKYFETIVFDRELANNLINTSFIQQFIQFLKNINNEQVRTRCCCIIGYLVRYATIIEQPLDVYGFNEIIGNVIKTAGNNSDLMKKASATLGEYLFYVGTQEETPENKEWKISNDYLKILLFCLEENRNEIVKFYTIKTIENICILTTVCKKYFASDDKFINKIIDIYLNSSNNELRFSAISTISHLIRHSSSLISKFLNKCPILTDTYLFLKEGENIQQCLINCLLYSLVGREYNEIFPKCDLFASAILKILDKANNVIKLKCVLLLGFFFNNNSLIIKYGEESFIKLQKLRNEKNRELHLSVKFFEKMFNGINSLLAGTFINLINKDNKPDEIINYCKIFNIIGIYHKISTSLFKKDFLIAIVNYIKSKNKNINEKILEGLFDTLLRFSENPLSVEENIDLILKSLLIDILKFTEIIKSEIKSTSILICGNILTIILNDDKLYSLINNNEGKTLQIKNLIKTILPLCYNLLKNNELIEESLSLLSLIIERDDQLINLYSKEGIIDYIFKIMTKEQFSNNLNILKILITLMESKEIRFNDIIKLNLVDKVNLLINNGLNSEDNRIYIDYVMELFYSMMAKLNDYKKKNFTNKDYDSFKKNFSSHIENVAKNFNLCIDLIGDDSNVSVQEMSCACLVYMLQFFPDSKFNTLNILLEFKLEDIPKLLKGLELSCNKIHKRMINIFKWIIQYQKNSTEILRPYVSYITTYLENICNTSAEPEVINTAQKFMNTELVKVK